MPITPDTTTPMERPLSGVMRLALVITTTSTIALFYGFIFFAILGMLLWIGFLLLAVVAVIRFGLAGFLTKFIERDVRVLMLLIRSLWLREGVAYRLPLRRADAPALFAMVERLAARFEIPPPDEMCLEMNSGAWVELRGLKTGIGTTRVGVGYDLLAALSEREVEAVMAHELAHAKLIGRFFNNQLKSGLHRAARVSNQLSSLAHAYRQANETFGPGDWILAISDSLTRWCARQIGAYSRQGEFEADRGAAGLCGSAAMRSSLQRLHDVEPILSRLPWNERVAQIESPEGLSQLLLRDLAGPVPSGEEQKESVDRYSTHPSLKDRLAALTEDGSHLTPSPSGLTLLAEPDKIALKLVGEIEATLLKREQEDMRELLKWLRKIRRTRHYRVAQLPGMLTIFAGIAVGFWSLAEGNWWAAVIAPLAFAALGVWFYRLGYYDDQRELTVPDFALFMNVRNSLRGAAVREREKEIESDLRGLIASVTPQKRRLVRLIEEAYAALGRCDYLHAHVAARLAAELDNDSIERALAMMIAAAAFHQGDTVNELFHFVLKRTSFRSSSSVWAAAWALLLLGDWSHAEALLHEARRFRPNVGTLTSMLALCQGTRGKFQSAIENIRWVCQSQSVSDEHLKLFVGLLLDRGALREVEAQWGKFSDASDPEVVFLHVRFHLLRREFAAAEQKLAGLDLTKTSGQQLLAVGLLYENARADESALKFFTLTLERGHYPEAYLALARHADKIKDRAKARDHVHAALDVTKPLGENAASAFAVFSQALAQLLDLEDANLDCRAWITSFLPGKEAGPLTNRSLIVYAPTENDAAVHLKSLLRAMKPDLAPATGASMNIKAAPRDMQPRRAVRPGVQYVFQ